MPGGRSTRAISSSAGSRSNQWKAEPATTASTLRSASGRSSARPSIAFAAGSVAVRIARISGSGSSAVTEWPAASSAAVSLPVPAPRSSTSSGSGPSSQAIVSAV